jgi:hypothetical protein
MVAQDFDYSDYLWGLNSKFKLEIGVENTIDNRYPDIIWFKQGTYLIASFNTSRSTNSFTITIQGKDKMCLLNGEIGGSLNSSIDFGVIEEENEDGLMFKNEVPIYDIIRNIVHIYGGEPYHNIIINDLNNYGLELLEYRYDKDTPLYFYRRKGSTVYTNITLDGEKMCNRYILKRPLDGPETIIPAGGPIALKDVDEMYLDSLSEGLAENDYDTEVSIFEFLEDLGTYWHVARVSYGQTAGYRRKDLVYAGDLIANAGESITSVLDKIKNMLVEFEYFYDLDGRFVF